MIFGLNLPNYGSLGHVEAVTAIADRTDELGYSSLWTSDHILLPATLPEPYGNLLESFTTLSYLAARTSRIRLATGILVLPQSCSAEARSHAGRWLAWHQPVSRRGIRGSRGHGTVLPVRRFPRIGADENAYRKRGHRRVDGGQ